MKLAHFQSWQELYLENSSLHKTFYGNTMLKKALWECALFIHILMGKFSVFQSV